MPAPLALSCLKRARNVRMLKGDMGRIVVASGSKDYFTEDVLFLSRGWSENPRIVTAAASAARGIVLDLASALFIEPDLVLALLDPAEEAVRALTNPLLVLKERANVIIYATTPGFEVPAELGAERVVVEKEKEKRFKDRVLAEVRAERKKMTDRAYALLKERVPDEALLIGELGKLVAFVGEKTVIDAKDVAAVVTEMHEEDFITLSEAMARKDRKEIVRIVGTLLSQGLSPLAINGFMTRHVQLLLQARDAAEFFKEAPDFRAFSKGFSRLKEDLGAVPLEKRHYLAFQKPYYAYNLCKSSRRTSEKTLLSLLAMLARFDRKVKQGTRHDRINFEEGLLGA